MTLTQELDVDGVQCVGQMSFRSTDNANTHAHTPHTYTECISWTAGPQRGQ